MRINKYYDQSLDWDKEQEYTVEFSCESTFLISFKDTGGLTEKQIIQKGIDIANLTFVVLLGNYYVVVLLFEDISKINQLCLD